MDTPRPRWARIAAAILSSAALLTVGLIAPWHTTRNAQAALTWRSLGEPGFASVVNAVSIDPRDSRHLLLGGEMNGISSSSDGGETFQPSTGLGDYEVGSFTWHPKNANEVWVGTMGGPYRSTDGGRTSLTSKKTGFAPTCRIALIVA